MSVNRTMTRTELLKRALGTVAQCKRRVVVTGLGIVSPLGCNTKSSWKVLIDGKCSIKKLEGPDYEKLPCRIGKTVFFCFCYLLIIILHQYPQVH